MYVLNVYYIDIIYAHEENNVYFIDSLNLVLYFCILDEIIKVITIIIYNILPFLVSQ